MKPIEQRLIEHSRRDGGCLVWTGTAFADGYGRMDIMGTARKAHRVAYAVWVALFPEWMSVLHTCDNPACIEPTHLALGTPRDNAAQMKRRGRHVSGRAPTVGADKKATILAAIEQGEGVSSISRRLGLSRSTVYRTAFGYRRVMRSEADKLSDVADVSPLL